MMPTPLVPDFDLYRELEVDPNASPGTIEAAWRSLLKQHHPDMRDGDPAAAERAERLNVAHDWLADPELRARYDRTTKPARRQRVPASDVGSSRTAMVTPGVPTTSAPTTANVISGSLPRRLATYYASCALAIAVAYVGSVVLAVLLAFANVSAMAAAILGEDATGTLIQLIGNVAYALIAGAIVASSYGSVVRRTDQALGLGALGTAATLGMTYGFPAFAISYLPGLAQWIAGDGAGLPAVLVVSVIQAVIVGSAVALLGFLEAPSQATATRNRSH